MSRPAAAKTRAPLARARRVVVKVGSALLTGGGGGLDFSYIGKLAEQIAAATEGKREVALVSSGAVAAGMQRLGWSERPRAQEDMQVAAAVGQMTLMNAYEEAFAKRGLRAGQALLTAEDMAHRTLYLNARAALRRMLKRAVVPVINENDVIATAAVQFGDNDRLAAQIANLLEADALLVLTSAPGLCRNAANLSDVVFEGRAMDDGLLACAQDNGQAAGVGRGGMAGKLRAARQAAASGAHSLIVDGRAPNCIARALAGEARFGTFLLADMPRLSARKRWLASGLHLRGRLVLDSGAAAAVVGGKRSLLPAGVVAAEGDFVRGDAVRLQNEAGETLGFALCNYDSAAARRLCGVKSANIEKTLGYRHEEEMAHRDNMSIAQ